MNADELMQQITTMDLNNMSTEELKSYSDSLQAQDPSLSSAADIVANESVVPVEVPDENSGLSLLDLKAKAKSLAQIAQVSTMQIDEEGPPVINASKQKELDEKAAVIATTEQANSAAMDTQ